MDNIYLKLTREFNEGKLRTILSSGQAVVYYKLAVMSKDGDWIVSEAEEDLNFILSVLQKYNAKYRCGAPLDSRWLKGGWSSHFEFAYENLRIRTDFVSRPPRLSQEQLKDTWANASAMDLPVIGISELAEIKKTDREKDYPVIGELARLIEDDLEQLLYSRSATDIIKLFNSKNQAFKKAVKLRPVLSFASAGQEKLEEELDRERREMMRVNSRRIQNFMEAGRSWHDSWLDLERQLSNKSLLIAHQLMVESALNKLPFKV